MDIKIYQKKARCISAREDVRGVIQASKCTELPKEEPKYKIGHKIPNLDFQIRSKVKSIIEMTSFISHNVKESDYNFYYD